MSKLVVVHNKIKCSGKFYHVTNRNVCMEISILRIHFYTDSGFTVSFCKCQFYLFVTAFASCNCGLINFYEISILK